MERAWWPDLIDGYPTVWSTSLLQADPPPKSLLDMLKFKASSTNALLSPGCLESNLLRITILSFKHWSLILKIASFSDSWVLFWYNRNVFYYWLFIAVFLMWNRNFLKIFKLKFFFKSISCRNIILSSALLVPKSIITISIK